MTTPQGTEPFDSMYAKLYRGAEHLQTLNDKIQEWAQSDPYDWITERSDDWTVFALGINFKRKPDFVKWAAMTGDVLSNFRSVLDYLIYGLAVTIRGDPPPKERSLQFPITDSDGSWNGAIKRHRLHGLDDSMIATIKAAQPHNRRDSGGVVLARLRDLNDPDKHRKLNLGYFSIHRPEDLRIGPVNGPFEIKISGDPLEDGAPVALITFERPNPEVEMDFRLKARVSLDDQAPGGPAVVVLLQEMYHEVLRIMQKFAL